MKRIYLSEGETGYAHDLGNNLVQVANIPFDGDYNLDDIVEIKSNGDGAAKIVRLVHRNFPVKTTIWYDETWQFYKICEMARLMDAKCEGATEPKDGKRGFMSVAAPDTLNALKLAEAIGIKDPQSKTPGGNGSHKK